MLLRRDSLCLSGTLMADGFGNFGTRAGTGCSSVAYSSLEASDLFAAYCSLCLNEPLLDGAFLEFVPDEAFDWTFRLDIKLLTVCNGILTFFGSAAFLFTM